MRKPAVHTTRLTDGCLHHMPFMNLCVKLLPSLPLFWIYVYWELCRTLPSNNCSTVCQVGSCCNLQWLTLTRSTVMKATAGSSVQKTIGANDISMVAIRLHTYPIFIFSFTLFMCILITTSLSYYMRLLLKTLVSSKLLIWKGSMGLLQQ